MSVFPSLKIGNLEINPPIIQGGMGVRASLANLPQYAQEKSVKLVPVVSSARAFKIICSRWRKRYNRLPDAVLVEGVKAGDHLGFHYNDVAKNTTASPEELVREIVPIANGFTPKIPVIAAGGM